MASYNVAEAKARLSELMSLAEAGEDVRLTRRGRPVVRMVRDEQPKKAVDIEMLRAHLASFGPDTPVTESTVVQMRRGARY